MSFCTPVLGGAIAGNTIELRTGGVEHAKLEAELVLNCAGLVAWASSRLANLDSRTSPPRFLAKGSYFSFSGSVPFRRLIYPVPEPGGLGIHLTFDLAGQARFGPDVQWIDRIDYNVAPERGQSFYSPIRRYWPTLPGVGPSLFGCQAQDDLARRGARRLHHPGPKGDGPSRVCGALWD